MAMHVRSLRSLLFTGVLTAALVGCAAADSGPASTDVAASPAAARIGSDEITVAELDAFIKDQLLEQQTGGDPTALHELRRSQIDNLIARRLLDAEAERRGLTPDEVLDAEASTRVNVTDEDMRAFFDANESQMGGRSFESLVGQIREYLERQQGAEAAQTFVAELRANAGVEVLIETPRVEVATTGSARGPVDAPVTIVEFSDYQCPFCVRAEPTIQQVLRQYEGKVRFVYKHFPLDSIHPLARPASEAAGCAEDQGKFWEYHDRVFAANAELAPESLEQFAEELSLDLDTFRTCVANRTHASRVSQDYADGEAAGVNSTPTFFINGVKLKGAQPFSEFQRIIDAELAATDPAA